MYQIGLFHVKKIANKDIYIKSVVTVQKKKWNLCET